MSELLALGRAFVIAELQNLYCGAMKIDVAMQYNYAPFGR
jgi:hypothetical protein